MAVGLPLKTTYANGDVYSASDVNDTNGTINANVNPFTAGKNRIINGDFGVWQRGTSFTNPAAFSYLVDRWRWGTDGVGSTTVFSRQTFTPGTAPVTGYEGLYFLRWNRSVATTLATYDDFYQPIENVQTGAGQTVTLSFWAKADSARTLNVTLSQNFGSGGSAQVSNIGTTSLSLTTSWARYSATISLPSIAGKTVGTGSSLAYTFRPNTLNTTFTFDIWGVQLEQGSTATAFQTATGTIQGELAACQRYYNRYTASGVYSSFASSAFAQSTTAGTGLFAFPVEMRIAPTAIDSSTLAFSKWDNTHYAMSSVTLDSATTSTKNAYVYGTGSGMTAGNIGYFGANNSASAYIGFSAEL